MTNEQLCKDAISAISAVVTDKSASHPEILYSLRRVRDHVDTLLALFADIERENKADLLERQKAVADDLLG